MKTDFNQAIKDATKAAIKAGDEWMENAQPKYVVVGYEDSPMLDLCGNAHVRSTDGRTAFGKYLKSLDRYCCDTVPLDTRYNGRQEHGLKVAMAKAALKVLTEDYGIKKLRIWDYID